MKFSACWIVKNESENIKRSIDSVKAIADELIVVDTGSTDDTVDVARAAGARVEYFEWIGDFSAARNYALSFAGGDVIFFLDADEWFSPALTAGDGEEMASLFEAHPEVDAIQVKLRNLNDQGAVKTMIAVDRIFRNGRGMRYKKKVHEQLVRGDGSAYDFYSSPKWPLDHSGYVEEIMQSKLLRNIELLEDAAKNSPDPEERSLQHCYLVREYYQSHDIENGLKHFNAVLKEPDMIKRQFAALNHGFAPLVYNMMLFASEPGARDKVSRNEIHKKIVEPFCRLLPDYAGTPTMELFYNALFDLKEEVILSRVATSIEAARRMPSTAMSYYHEAEMIIHQNAAAAALRRGKLTEAMDYAVESFKYTQNNNAISLHVLLSCMRGIPAEEIIYFLNSQFDLNNAQKLCFLSRGTRMHGFREIHAYYLDKQIKAGLASKADYLYLLLLYGKHGEAVKTALEVYNEDIAAVVDEHIFLAAICADDKQIYLENKKYLSRHDNLLEAYFSGAYPEKTDNNSMNTLVNDYGKIALAAGLERADKFRALFYDQSLLCFQIKARYCVENGLYEDVLSETMPEDDDVLSNRYVVESLVSTGRCAEALERIERLFTAGLANDDLLRYLLSVADRSSGGIKSRAKALCDKYVVQCDKFIDLRDFVNTAYVTEDTDKKKQRTYKSLTLSQFNKQLAEEEGKPNIEGFPELYEQAGAIYVKKDMPATAMECYRSAYAQGYNKSENKDRIVGFFKNTGNARLAAELEKAL